MTIGLLVEALTGLWLIWAAYWIGSVVYESATNKTKETERRIQGTGFLFFILLFFILPPYGTRGALGWLYYAPPLALKVAGVALVAVSLSFAIWARRHLGANWSGIPSLKKGHTLITTGPYSLVRHPIYTGLLFGFVGSTLELGTLASLAALALAVVIVSIRIRQEEGLMTSQFGDAYAEYRKKAKTIIPWLY